mgnify:CR=1 FL=1|jgi:hypothetical protein
MLSEEKIKIMTNLAIFEKNQGKKIITVKQYFKSDYISGKLFRAFFSYTLSFMLCLTLWIVYYTERWLNTVDVAAFIEIGRKVGKVYLAGLILYLLITLVVYARRYDYASRGIKVYIAKLKRLDKRYEGSARPGTRTKGGRTQ